jgi:RIO-like serine/threonine protein kinase
MTLSEKQSETLRNIRNSEKTGQRRFIYAAEAQDLTKLGLVEKQAGVEPSYRLTARGWQALEVAEEQLSVLVTL